MQGPARYLFSKSCAIPAAMMLSSLFIGGVADAQRAGAQSVADIAAFVQWPDAAEYGLSFRLCLRDDDPAFGQFMSQPDMTIQGKPLTVHAIAPEAFGERPCHLAYFSPGYADAAIIERLKRKPVLTISPENGFAARGGLVELNNDGGRTVLVMDRAAILSHPLAFKAQLLAISHQAGE
ncbi:MAG: YfiR family protein [Pseudomonadota bacterium]